ncbi:MAG: hypothetical protein ACKVJK_20960, partial [Methylophagaceae bacterium]
QTFYFSANRNKSISNFNYPQSHDFTFFNFGFFLFAARLAFREALAKIADAASFETPLLFAILAATFLKLILLF